MLRSNNSTRRASLTYDAFLSHQQNFQRRLSKVTLQEETEKRKTMTCFGLFPNALEKLFSKLFAVL